MKKILLSTVAAAVISFAVSPGAVAGPMHAQSSIASSGSVTLVHGFHRGCQLGNRGWHRHNDWGQRRPCRVWQGGGKRPDFCVRVGNLVYCDY
jgi:hypothetical protein